MNDIHQKDLQEIEERHKEEILNLDSQNHLLKKELEKLIKENDEFKKTSSTYNWDLSIRNKQLEEKLLDLEESIICTQK